MKPTIYLETTIVSYLTSLPSRDLITAAHQQVTHEWWETRRFEFDLCISQIVVQESSAGDKNASKRRLAVLEDIPLLEITENAFDLADKLIKHVPLGPKAEVDALHVAIAVVNGIDYLLTWNCKHLANALLRNKIETVSRNFGYEPPVICTPEELMEE